METALALVLLSFLLGFSATPSTADTTYSVSLYTPCISGLRVDVNGYASNGSLVASINWNWGDGNMVNHAFPASHLYGAPGTYTVTVVATYTNGSTASAFATVSVDSGVLGSCNALTISAGAGGSASYNASVGSGMVSPGNPQTVYLARADYLIISASPNAGYSFESWVPSSGITGLNGAPVATTSRTTTIVVNASSSVAANFVSISSSTSSSMTSTTSATTSTTTSSTTSGGSSFPWTPVFIGGGVGAIAIGGAAVYFFLGGSGAAAGAGAGAAGGAAGGGSAPTGGGAGGGEAPGGDGVGGGASEGAAGGSEGTPPDSGGGGESGLRSPGEVAMNTGQAPGTASIPEQLLYQQSIYQSSLESDRQATQTMQQNLQQERIRLQGDRVENQEGLKDQVNKIDQTIKTNRINTQNKINKQTEQELRGENAPSDSVAESGDSSGGADA